MYSYYTGADMDIHILYFNLEETKEKVMTRFISWLLYEWTKGKIRVSPRDLMSSKNDKPLSKEVLDILEEEDFIDVLDYFESKVEFFEEKNPTGIYKACKNYVKAHGTIHTKPTKYKDEFGVLQETEGFDYYVPNNPNEYVFAVVDTINIIDTERGFTLKQAIDKLSQYFIELRNRYNLSPIVIQQQNQENESIESIKINRNRPSLVGLGDSKNTGKDSNICLGIFSPYRFGLKEYLGGYPIDKLKDHFRTLEVLSNRDGEMGGIVPLYFDGNTCNWFEMPKLEDSREIAKICEYIASLDNPKPKGVMLFNKLIKRNG